MLAVRFIGLINISVGLFKNSVLTILNGLFNWRPSFSEILGVFLVQVAGVVGFGLLLHVTRTQGYQTAMNTKVALVTCLWYRCLILL